MPIISWKLAISKFRIERLRTRPSKAAREGRLSAAASCDGLAGPDTADFNSAVFDPANFDSTLFDSTLFDPTLFDSKIFDLTILFSFAGGAVTSLAGAGAAADPGTSVKAELAFCAGDVAAMLAA